MGRIPALNNVQILMEAKQEEEVFVGSFCMF